MKKFIVVALAWACVAASWRAQAGLAPLTLDEAVEHALRDAPQIAVSSATLEGARAAAPAAGRLPDPELIAGVDNFPVDTADRFSFARDFMTMRKIGVMQSFPNRAKRRLQGERAQRDVALAKAELRKTQYETAKAAADAWIALAVSTESLARLREFAPQIQLQAVAGRAAVASGRVSVSEALAAQTQAARFDERIASLEQDVEMQRAELERWIGADAAVRPLAAIPAEQELGPTAQMLVAAVPEHAPLAPIVAQLAATQTEVELARAERRPDWSTELNYAQRGPGFSNMVSLEFRVSLPVFPQHRQNAQIAAKLAAVRAQEAQRDADVRMHTAEVRAMLTQWQRGRERLQRYSMELTPLARDRVRTSLASYGAGRADLRGVVEALSEQLDTDLDRIQLQGEVARAWVFLHWLHDAGAQP